MCSKKATMLKGGPTGKSKEEATSLERLVSEHSTLQNATQALDGLVQYAPPSTIRVKQTSDGPLYADKRSRPGSCCRSRQSTSRKRTTKWRSSLVRSKSRVSCVLLQSLWPATINPAVRPSLLCRHPAAGEPHHEQHQGAQVAGSRHHGRLHLHLHLCPPPLLALLSEMTFFMNMSLYIRIELRFFLFPTIIIFLFILWMEGGSLLDVHRDHHSSSRRRPVPSFLVDPGTPQPVA